MFVLKSSLMMQNQGTTSTDAIKVPNRNVLRAQEKKIKDTLNMLIQVIEESRHIWEDLGIFRIFLYIILYYTIGMTSYLLSFLFTFLKHI